MSKAQFILHKKKFELNKFDKEMSFKMLDILMLHKFFTGDQIMQADAENTSILLKEYAHT